jgi:hypothetical protein
MSTVDDAPDPLPGSSCGQRVRTDTERTNVSHPLGSGVERVERVDALGWTADAELDWFGLFGDILRTLADIGSFEGTGRLSLSWRDTVYRTLDIPFDYGHSRIPS